MLETYSNWLLTWFILFYFRIVPYNPFTFIIIAYIITIGFFFYLCLKNAPKYKLIKYFIINLFTKLFLLILIIRSNDFNYSYMNGLFGIALYSIYFIYMIYTKQNPFIHYQFIINSYMDEKIILNHPNPISRLYDFIYDKIFK